MLLCVDKTASFATLVVAVLSIQQNHLLKIMVRKRKQKSEEVYDQDNEYNTYEHHERNDSVKGRQHNVDKDNKKDVDNEKINNSNNNEGNQSTFAADIPNEVSNDLISYVLTVGEEINGMYDDTINTMDDEIAGGENGTSKRSLLLSNVWSEIQGQEASISCHKAGSKVIEDILSLSRSLSQMHSFLYSIRRSFGYMSYDAFGSHVLETLFKTSAEIVYKYHQAAKDGDNSNNDSEKERLIKEKEQFEDLVATLCGDLSKVGKY